MLGTVLPSVYSVQTLRHQGHHCSIKRKYFESLTQPFYHHGIGIDKMLRKTLENRFPSKKSVFFLVS